MAIGSDIEAHRELAEGLVLQRVYFGNTTIISDNHEMMIVKTFIAKYEKAFWYSHASRHALRNSCCLQQYVTLTIPKIC